MSGGLLYLVFGTLAATAYFTVPGFHGNGLVFSAIGLSAAGAILVGAFRNRPRQRLPWLLFASAQVSFVVGDLLYYTFHFTFPSVGDVFYLAVYPLLVAGLLVLIRARTPGHDRGNLIDASVITVGLGLLAWVFLIQPYTHLEGLKLLERVMSMMYPLMDVMLLAVVARLAIGSGTRPLSFYLIGVGIVSLLATDAIYGYIELHTGYTQGGLLDAGWLAYYLLWGTAALLPGMRRLDEPASSPQPTLTGRRLLPLAAATLIAPAVGIIQSLQEADRSVSVSAVASAGLFLLVLARMTGLVKSLRRSVDEEHRALFREGVLRRAAVALGGAPERDAVAKASLEAATSLVADAGDVEVTVALAPVGAGSPRAPGNAQSPGVGACLEVLEVPITTQGSAHGAIRVAGPRPLPAPVRAALDALGAQAAVALERASLADDLLRRRSDERLTAVGQHASDVIMVLDADLVVRHHTTSYGRFLKYEPAALVGGRLLDLVHPDDAPSATSFFSGLLARAGTQQEVEVRLRSGEGSWVAVDALGNNLLEDPRVQGVVLVVRDATKRKALEDGLKRQVAELKELDRIKTDLVSTVSHELRTPLTTLVGHVEMLTDGEFGALSADQLRAVHAIDRNSQRLLSLVQDLLTMAKIENEGMGLTLVPTDVPSVLAEVEISTRPLVADRALTVRAEAAPGIPPVLGDRSGLERVLSNLISNAVKFTPDGGSVTTRVTADGVNAVFAVSDSGIGMDAEDQRHLFTRFFRSPLATSMAIPGTGLGLAIVKKIVDDHRGTIRVDSELGTGTTVTFTIPLARAGDGRPSPADAATRPDGLVQPAAGVRR